MLPVANVGAGQVGAAGRVEALGRVQPRPTAIPSLPFPGVAKPIPAIPKALAQEPLTGERERVPTAT